MFMSFLSEQPDRQGLMLARLASLHLELAESLQQRALEAESVEDAVKLSTAFAQVARGLRQTLALDMRLIRFRREIVAYDAGQAKEAADAEAEAASVEAAAQAREDKAADIRELVEPLIWNEHERPETEADELQDRFESWLVRAMNRSDYDRCCAGSLAGEIAEMLGVLPPDEDEEPEPEPGLAARTPSAHDLSPEAPAAAHPPPPDSS